MRDRSIPIRNRKARFNSWLTDRKSGNRTDHRIKLLVEYHREPAVVINVINAVT